MSLATRKPAHRRALLSLAGLSALILSSCASKAPLDSLKPASSRAREIRSLNRLVFPIAGIVMVLVAAAVIFCVVKFRAKDGDNELPEQIHGNFKLEIGWTILPALILVGIAVPTVSTIWKIAKMPAKGTALEVNVIGQQWWWSYEYPGTGVITANEMVIPAGKDVVLRIQSRDVIHSFWVPQLSGKKDAVPGRIHDLVISADNPGYYQGQCTEFCGLSHSYMRASVRVLSQPDFDAWLANQKREYTKPADDTPEGRGLAAFGKCSGCHQINGYNKVAVADQISGAAPNLTHLMSRDLFAGGNYLLKNADGTVNENLLKKWLRNPDSLMPMVANNAKAKAGPNGSNKRGMPNLNLTEQEISDLVAFLKTLK